MDCMKPTPAIAALAALAATTAVATGATVKPTIKPSHNTTLNKTIVVDAKKGMTLYWLSPETKKQLLCKTTTCTGFWPPLTVKSLHTKVRAAFGIQGKLTVFKRPDGKFQVALRGEPLYHFAGDSAKGQANGEGIQTFGGTWHAVVARTTSGY
jgi:predicted lipoprotein with Yx(FWY)xxD motif